MLIDRKGVTHFIPARRASEQVVNLYHIPAKPEKLCSWRKMADFDPEDDQAFIAYLDPVQEESDKFKIENLATDPGEVSILGDDGCVTDRHSGDAISGI